MATGAVSTRYFTFSDDTSNKFWQIAVADTSFTVTYGRIGTAGQSQKKEFDTPEKCTAEAAKLIREKTGKGYTEVIDGVTVESSTPPSERKPRAMAASAGKEAEEATLAAYNSLIERSAVQELLPFLESAAPAHYAALRKRIKAARKHYNEYVKLEPGEGTNNKNHIQWGLRGNDKQRDITNLAGLAMLPKEDVKSFDFLGRIHEKNSAAMIDAILDWARPAWFTDYLNEQGRANSWQTIEYTKLRTWEELGYVHFLPELFARSVSSYNQYRTQKDDPYYYLDYLTTDSTVRTREIPLLFEYETDMHNTHGFVKSPGNTANTSVPVWSAVLARLVASGDIDRMWLLESCITVQSKDWNANLRSFFRKIAEDMKPLEAELLQLQSAIMQLLGAQHPHVVNWAAGIIKDVAGAADFRMEELAEWSAAVMMRSDCKAAVKTLLSVFEKNMKTVRSNASFIGPVIADVFAMNDLALQTKAASLLNKFADPANELLAEKMQMYESQMLGTLRSELASFLQNDHTDIAGVNAEPLIAGADYHYTAASLPARDTLEEVKLPADWNELLFLVGKFTASDNILDVERVINAIILAPETMQLAGNEQLQPYIKQLTKKSTDSWIWNYTRSWLLHIFTGNTEAFDFGQQYQSDVRTLQLHKERLRHAHTKFVKKSRLPLLSLPTHAYWIAPQTLMQRLLDYHQAGEHIDIFDLGIAIARMHPEGAAAALPLTAGLDKPLQKLMRFVCTGAGEPELKKRSSMVEAIFNRLNPLKEKPKETNAWSAIMMERVWAVAARTRQPEGVFEIFRDADFADRPNVVSPLEPQYKMAEKWNEYRNYRTKEMERSPSWYELSLSLTGPVQTTSVLLYSNDLHMQTKTKWYYYGIAPYDVEWWHSIIPNAPESLFTVLVQYCCRQSSTNQGAVQGLHILLEPHARFGTISMLLVACNLMAEKRDTRGLAAEVLIRHFEGQTIDAKDLGAKTGWLLTENYAPVLRFTESLQMIKDVSPQHNKALYIMLDAVFAQFGKLEELPKNTKKLLETYLDLLVKLGEKPAPATIVFLEKHKSSGTLKPIISSIIKLA